VFGPAQPIPFGPLRNTNPRTSSINRIPLPFALGYFPPTPLAATTFLPLLLSANTRILLAFSQGALPPSRQQQGAKLQAPMALPLSHGASTSLRALSSLLHGAASNHHGTCLCCPRRAAQQPSAPLFKLPRRRPFFPPWPRAARPFLSHTHAALPLCSWRP
jgi:hypothetical protein